MAKRVYIGVLSEVGKKASEYSVGDSVFLKVNRVATEFIVVHQGLPSSLYDSSCNGTWLVMKDIYKKSSWHSSSSNNYSESSIHRSLNNTFLNSFDADTKACIKTVKIPYVNGTGSSAVASGSSGLSTQAFLLSSYEVGFTTTTNRPVDGACLSYFSDGEKDKLIAKYDDTAQMWWTRSPYGANTTHVWVVSNTGSSSYGNATTTIGVRPAIILSGDALFNRDTNVFGGEMKEVARNVKKMYVGVEGIARRVKKAYVGIGGVARPCFGGILEYYGSITPLSYARSSLAATTIGNYALFGGGSNKNAVDAYNKSLTRTEPTALGTMENGLAATTVGGLAIFKGTAVWAYNASLTRTSPTESYVAINYLAATTVGGHALFGGGFASGGGISVVVDAFDTSLTRTKATDLAVAREYLSATTVGGYALFAGGSSGYRNQYTTVDAYDTSLTRTTPTALSVGRSSLAASAVGGYALFGGGEIGIDGCVSTVDVYNKSLTRTTPITLSVAKCSFAATTIGDYALFGGGFDGDYNYSNIVDAYDKSLTRTNPTGLSVGRSLLAATTIGSYALFGGGDGNNGGATVDAYTI